MQQMKFWKKIFKFCQLKKISYPRVKSYKLVKKKKTNFKSLNLVEAYSKELLKFVKKNKKSNSFRCRFN